MATEETHVFICDVCSKRETKDNRFKPFNWVAASMKTDVTEWGQEFLVCNTCRDKNPGNYFKMIWELMHPRKEVAK